MPRLYSGRKIISALLKAGFLVVSQKGSHVKLRKLAGEKTLTTIVPVHKEVAWGTLQSILEQANLSKEELEEYI